MSDFERILIECRYLISLNKNYDELSKILKIDKEIVYNDLNVKLKNYDSILFTRVSKILNKCK